ncbi:DUF6339 family protein [Amycolatopsis sp. NPDC003861]
MTDAPAVNFPAVLGHLSDAAVTKYLSRGMQAGQETPPQTALRKVAVALPDHDLRWRTAPVRELVEEAMSRFEDRADQADAWLAPRLHATLRMTRAEAAEKGLWNYLAMLVAPDYVVWRHKGAEIAKTTRFCGLHYVQAFARLWWAAELFRDGADYGPVETVFVYQDTPNSIMRSDVIDHRPTAAAMLRVIRRLADDNVSRGSDHVNALSKAVNAAGSTLVFDVLAPESPADGDALRSWIADSASMPPVPWDRLPDGPEDGAVDPNSVDALVPLFEKLLSEAPLRDRSKRTEPD